MSAVATVTVEEAAAWLQAGEAILIDVREPDEWDESHLLAATNIPLGDIPSRTKDIPAGEVWVHCRMGGRAGKACDYLRDNRSDLDIHWINEPYTNAALANIPVS